MTTKQEIIILLEDFLEYLNQYVYTYEIYYSKLHLLNHPELHDYYELNNFDDLEEEVELLKKELEIFYEKLSYTVASAIEYIEGE